MAPSVCDVYRPPPLAITEGPLLIAKHAFDGVEDTLTADFKLLTFAEDATFR